MQWTADTTQEMELFFLAQLLAMRFDRRGILGWNVVNIDPMEESLLAVRVYQQATGV